MGLDKRGNSTGSAKHQAALDTHTILTRLEGGVSLTRGQQPQATDNQRVGQHS